MKNKRIGLCLSGGGYRAAAYHIGTLRKLKEMEILSKVDVISSNSGGSITAATYCLNLDDFDQFEQVMLSGIKSSVIGRLVRSIRFVVPALIFLVLIFSLIYFLFTGFAWISTLLLTTMTVLFLFFQYSLFPLSSIIEGIYNSLFIKNKALGNLPKKPTLVINSTNTETGRLFTFSEDKMGDSKYSFPDDGGEGIEFCHEDFPVARAVSASTSVPFIFSPVRVNAKYFKNKSDTSRANPRLVDGGVYDNQGIHKIAFESSSYACDTIIVSDAGNEMPFKHTYRNTLALLIRVSNVFMNRIKNLQIIELLYDAVQVKNREVAFHSLGWSLRQSIPEFIRSLKNDQILPHVWKSHGITVQDIKNEDWNLIKNKLEESVDYDQIIEHANSDEETELARSVGTNLTPLSEEEIKVLVNHAYLMTELQVKLYCPSLIN